MSDDATTSAVIVIDLQTGMLDGETLPRLHDADALLERVRAVIAWARRTGRPLAFIRHDGEPGDPLEPGAPGWPLFAALGRRDDEPIFSKTVADAFSQPALGAWLDAQGTSEVILLGAQSDECVAATTRGALGRGLRAIVVGDAHSTYPSGGLSAAQIIARENDAAAQAGARLTSTQTLIAR
ncbi:MAG TPA: isochorismatase family protein [Candidatus Sulfotelmatobacter sp.]|nr:isochorismatase family protein [Candidatus Sulfotelmatobacter sp.]